MDCGLPAGYRILPRAENPTHIIMYSTIFDKFTGYSVFGGEGPLSASGASLTIWLDYVVIRNADDGTSGPAPGTPTSFFGIHPYFTEAEEGADFDDDPLTSHPGPNRVDVF